MFVSFPHLGHFRWPMGLGSNGSSTAAFATALLFVLVILHLLFFIAEGSRVQDTRLRMPNKWHMFKEGKASNKKRQRRGLLVFSELSSLPSAGSRPGCFHTSLGCEPRSLIRVSLGCSIIQKKNVRKDSPTPAYSLVSDRRRPTALVEVHWAYC
jgi:hypothetical protein